MKHALHLTILLLATLLGLSSVPELSAQTLADAIDMPSQSITNSGNQPWTAQTTTTHDGVDAAKSGTITDSQTSEMSTTVTGPGTLSFWWKVSSESGYDYLRFYIDGEIQSERISGEVDWSQKSYELSAGSHTLKWAYSKDNIDTIGSDCGWVDQVVFVPPTPAPEIAVEQPVGTGITDGSASVAFGSTDLGITVVKTFTIKNLGGSESLTGLSLSKDGTNASEFTLGMLGATTLAPGASTTFTVTFAPTALGSKSAAIHIASNDADENPFDINLAGSGGAFTYTTSAGKVTITGYTGSGGAVTIPDTINGLPVASIGYNAFNGRFSITSVTIPNSVTSIDSYAFADCSGLTSVTIPSSVSSIGFSAFSGCSMLTQISAAPLNPNYSSLDGVLFDKSQNLVVLYPPGLTGAYVIPINVTGIGGHAFFGCRGLTSVSLPNSLTDIGSSAFFYCSGLTSVTLPNSLTNIASYAFEGCNKLASATFLGNAPTVGSNAFSNAASNFKVIYYNETNGFTSPTWMGYASEVIPPNTAPEIAVEQPAGTYLADGSASVAFGNANVGTTVVKTFTIKNLGTADILTGLSLSKDGTNASDFTLGTLGATNLAAGGSTTFTVTFAPTAQGLKFAAIHIASNDADENPFDIFLTAMPFTYTTAGGKVTITGYTGSGGAVTIPAIIDGLPVVSIDNSAFSGKSSITSITLPDGINRIGYYAFEDCSGLASVSIPSGVTRIGDYAFSGCSKLTQISVAPLNPNYSSLDGVLFNKDRSQLIQCPAAKMGVYVIPSGVTSIWRNAFDHCSGLTSVMFPNSLTSIGYYAFFYCSGLTSVTILNGVTSLGEGAFSECSGLTSVTIPYGVTSIGRRTFDACSSLTSMTIPNSVTSIEDYAFAWCHGLTSITIPNSVTSISYSAFDHCSALGSVIISAGVTSIGAGAFANCRVLGSALFLGNAPSMPSGVFSGAATGFTIHYNSAQTGFTTPTWNGYPAVPLAATREIVVVGQSGASLADGGGAIDFGDAYLGAVSRHVFTIRNLGATDLTGLAITKDGAQAGDFTVSSLGKTTLMPGDETAFTVTFAPTAVGVRNAAIHIASNDADENPFDISLTGEGLNRIAPFEGSRRIAGTANEDDELVAGMALDAAGNRLVTGWFDGTSDFGGVSLSALAGGGQDVFVGKYNSAGTLQWARRAGGNTSARDAGRGIGVDNAGNVYVTGGFSGSADFGGFTQTTTQSQSFFLAKYDSAGVVQWVRQHVGGSAAVSAYGTGLAVDGSGNSYAVGYYEGGGVTFSGTTLPAPAHSQCFLVKHDRTGALVWAKALPATGSAYATKVAVDSSGNICVGGDFSGSLTIGSTTVTSVGGKDWFLAKFSSAGALQWLRQAGGAGDEMGDGGVAVDATGNVFFVGAYKSNPATIGGVALANSGDWDACIAKYNSAGTLQWAKRAGAANIDAYLSVGVDTLGNAYAVGTMGTGSTSPAGTGGAVVAKYDANGLLQWDYAATGPAASPASSVATHAVVDSAGNCHLVGWFQGQATFGTQVLQPSGYWNYFMTTVSADPFAGAYPNLAWDYNDNVIYLEEDGVEKSTEGYLKIVRNDATHYAAEIREGPDGAVIPNLVRTGNRLQLDSSPMDMGNHNILDFIMLSDGTNRVFAGTGQEKSDTSDISITVHSWSGYTGAITADDFVGNWTFNAYDDDLLDPNDRFESNDPISFEIRKTGADTLDLVTPWSYSLPLRVSGNQAFLETPTVGSGTKYFTFRICTDGKTLSFHALGKDDTDSGPFAVIGLGVKQGTDVTKPVVTDWLISHGFSAETSLLADPNGDGVSLLMAYALNLNPTLDLRGSMPRPVITATDMKLTFYAGNPDVTYLVETSTDLNVWSTVGVTLSATDTNGMRTATFLKAGPTRFMRLRVAIRNSTAYSLWRSAAFSVTELANATVSGDLADPDQDGVANLLEYAMAGQAKVANTAMQPTVGQASGYLTLTYRQNKDAVDLLLIPEAASELNGPWSASGLVETGRVDQGSYWRITVRDAVPITTSLHRFMRLRVEQE